MSAHPSPSDRASARERAQALVVALLLLLANLALLTGQADAVTTTVVSLTFDDGHAEQWAAKPILASHGMHGTFYINSGRIGAANYLNLSQLQQLAADGNEIGGHTIDHVDLPTLDPAEQERQVCNDRVALTNLGFTPRSFAFPYGDSNGQAQQVVQGCGYNSARTVGGVVSPGACVGCPYAETIPPDNPYYTQTPDSIKASTTLADLQTYVTQAEKHGGGWVQLVMHYVCDGCSDLSVNPTVLSSFLDWLRARAGSGTVVKTVDQVIGGASKPLVNGPAPAPTPTSGNILPNPSLEADANNDGVPDCWQFGGFGNNTATWSRTPQAHTGSFAEKVAISSFTDGDRKLLVRQDTGGCSMTPTAGHSYDLAVWYQSTMQVRLVVYVRDSSGWSYWVGSPYAPASVGWSQLKYTTPAVPSTATLVSIGLQATAAGSFTADDFSMVDRAGLDTAAPTVSVTTPATNGSVLSGFSVPVSASAADNVGVAKVEFYLDGLRVATATAAPWQGTMDSTLFPDGTYDLTAVATDTSANTTTSAARSIVISNYPSNGLNLVNNPSLERLGSSGLPACYLRGSSGTNTAAWSGATVAHTGSVASTVSISAWTSGDRKLVTAQDTGACAPAVTPGQPYSVQEWYQATIPTRFVSYYRNAAGTWVYWTSSPYFGASAGYALAQWTTPPVPPGATLASFGLALERVGTLTVDDFRLTPYDTVAPAVTVTAPGGGWTQTATPQLSGAAGTATGDQPSISVALYPGTSATGKPTGSLTAQASGGNWTITPTTALPAGTYTAVASQMDWAGNTGNSAPLTFTVDLDAPSPTLIAPANGSVVENSTPTLTGTGGTATGDGTVSVALYTGATTSGAPTRSADVAVGGDGRWTLTPTALPDGLYTVVVTQRDAAGHVGTSAPSSLRIDTTAPAVTLTAPADGAWVRTATPTLAGTAGTAIGDLSTVDVAVYAGPSPSGAARQTVTAPVSADGTWSVGTSALTDGLYSAVATQRDSGGGVSTSSAVSFTVDTVAPSPAVTTPTDGSRTASPTPSLTGTAGTAAGDVTSVSVRLYAGSSASGTPTMTLTAPVAPDRTWSVVAPTLTDGAYSVLADQHDAAGNAGTSAAVSFTVDTTRPSPAITAPVAGAGLASATPRIAGTAGTATGDAGTVTVALYAGQTTTGQPAETAVAAVGADGTWSWTVPSLSDGSYTAVATQGNAAGASGTSLPVTFAVDTMAPTPTLVSPTGSNPLGTARPTITGTAGTASGDASSVLVTIHSGADQTGPVAATLAAPTTGGTWSLTPTNPLSDGAYTAVISQSDAAGNVGTSAPVTFTVDTVQPAPRITGPAGGATVVTSTPPLSGTAGTAAGDAATVSVAVYPGATTTGAPATQTTSASVAPDGTWSLSPAKLIDGTYTAAASQRDTAGNTGTSAPVTFTVNTNLVSNPSLETTPAGSAVPTCFQQTGYGTNAPTWIRTTDTHSGSFAQTLTVSSWTSGDRKLVVTQDAGTCAPAVTAGHSYRVSAFFKGSWSSPAAVNLVVYYRNSAGSWVYWTGGPALTAGSSWARATLTTPAVPSGATALSFGLGLSGVGTLTTDDYSIIDTVN